MIVSIIITTYNYEKYVKECIDSCLNQNNFEDFEVIVIDDGSKDNTLQILEEIQDPKFKFFSIKNGGIEYASNYGMKRAKGTYLVRVDADDKLHPDYLSSLVPLLDNLEYSFAYSDYYIIDNSSEIISQSNLPAFDEEEVMSRGDFLATGTLYRKDDLEKIGFYSENVRNCGLENYELMMMLLADNKKGICLNKHLFYYRRHSLNMSETKRNKIIEYGKALYKRLELGEFRTNEYHPYQLKL